MKQQGVHPEDAEGTSEVSSRPDTGDDMDEHTPDASEKAGPARKTDAEKRAEADAHKRTPTRKGADEGRTSPTTPTAKRSRATNRCSPRACTALPI
jgi:hypothetical protein